MGAVEQALSDVRASLAGVAEPSDDEIAAAARQCLPVHGIDPSEPMVDYVVDAVKYGPQRASRRHALRAFREIYCTIVDSVGILKKASIPSFLNVPHESEWPDWQYTSVEWTVHPVLALTDPQACATLIRILLEAPLDEEADREPRSWRSFTIWFKPSPDIDVMAGKIRIGTVPDSDRARLRPLIVAAAGRKHVVEAGARAVGTNLENLVIHIDLPEPEVNAPPV